MSCKRWAGYGRRWVGRKGDGGILGSKNMNRGKGVREPKREPIYQRGTKLHEIFLKTGKPDHHFYF